MQKFIAIIAQLILSTQLSVAQYAPAAQGELVEHTFYSLDYCEEHESASWVYYTLTAEHLDGTATRTDNFRPDPKVSTGSATSTDYKYSGYDRGHLLPAGDCSHSKEAMSESFYMSNIAPQKGSLNRAGWRTLETQVREWAREYKELHIVVGGVLDSTLVETIGPNKVSVPRYFYKVIYAPTEQKMIGFIMPNDRLTKPIPEYATTVDEVERITGIDLYPQLPDAEENKLESTVNPNNWSW